jgi:hypothetical protein
MGSNLKDVIALMVSWKTTENPLFHEAGFVDEPVRWKVLALVRQNSLTD